MWKNPVGGQMPAEVGAEMVVGSVEGRLSWDRLTSGFPIWKAGAVIGVYCFRKTLLPPMHA